MIVHRIPLLYTLFIISNIISSQIEGFSVNPLPPPQVKFCTQRIKNNYKDHITIGGTKRSRRVLSKISKLHSTENNFDEEISKAGRSSRIEKFLQEVGREVTQNKNVKEINLELVSLGQEFNSFRRRFDYLELLSPENDNDGKDSDGEYDDDDDDEKEKGSFWIRNNSENVNVEEFLMAFNKQEADELKKLSQIQSIFSIKRKCENLNEMDVVNSETISNSKRNMNIRFQIKSIQGIGIELNDIDDADVKISWEGNKYITEYQLQNNHNEARTLRVERYLLFNDSVQNMKMVVKSTLNIHGIHESKMVQCEEIYYPILNFDRSNDDHVNLESLQIPTSMKPLRSELERVPGCIANVNIFTTLIPTNAHYDGHDMNDTYHVLVDGETDTLLSKGLLSVLSSALSKLSIDDTLTIDPYTIADELNLRSVLSAGRNDGLSNMVTIVQNQIRKLMNDKKRPIDYEDENNVESETNAIEEDTRKPTVAVLLSGGVDSAVALNLLCQQDYDVTAFYLKIWLEDELAHLGQCPWEDDYSTCIEVCKHAGNIPLEAISLQDAYKDRVISYTIEEAKKGRTPNPDIMCNSRIKFGCFYDAIADRGFDYVASGHYAQLQKVENGVNSVMKLLRAPDPVKDQSYFLAALRQDQLKRVLFPIGHLQKSDVRALAEEFDLPNKSRPDSQGLCFLGKVKFDEFLSAYLGKNEGDIVDAHTGEIIGRHNGIWYHTVGQRKGIGKVLNPKATSRGPWYVVAKDPANRKIIASNKYDEEIFHETRSEFYVEDIRWISSFAPDQLTSIGNEMTLMMKIRHGPTIVTGTLEIDTMSSGTIHLEEKDGGLAPGQFVAFYDDMECLGSGVISEKHWLKFRTDSKGKEVAYNE